MIITIPNEDNAGVEIGIDFWDDSASELSSAQQHSLDLIQPLATVSGRASDVERSIEWNWAKNAGSTTSDQGSGISFDSYGNAYVIGLFQDSVDFGSTTLTNSGGFDVFVAKLDSAGTWEWAKSAGGSSSDLGNGIAVDWGGNSYITGYFGTSADFGSTTLISSDSSEVFIAKLNRFGNWDWAKSAGGNSIDHGNGIAVDGIGNSYIIGEFKGSSDFGTTTITSVGGIDVFFAKLDTFGDWVWVQRAGGTDDDRGMGVVTDFSGNAYFIGYFRGSSDGFNVNTIHSFGGSDVFVAARESNGNWLEGIQLGGTAYDFGIGIAVDSSGVVAITGSFNSSAEFGNTTLNSLGSNDVFIGSRVWDTDGDSVSDLSDSCRNGFVGWGPSNLSNDFDGDGCKDVGEDDDDDGDGHLDINDDFPLNEKEWIDTDGDGKGNNEDLDDDDDGYLDTLEVAKDSDPYDPQDVPEEFSVSLGFGIEVNAFDLIGIFGALFSAAFIVFAVVTKGRRFDRFSEDLGKATWVEIDDLENRLEIYSFARLISARQSIKLEMMLDETKKDICVGERPWPGYDSGLDLKSDSHIRIQDKIRKITSDILESYKKQ